MKKIILAICALFILSGCNATYALNVNKNLSFDETLIVENFQYFTNSNEFNEYINANYKFDSSTIFNIINNENDSYSLKSYRKVENLKDLESEEFIISNIGNVEFNEKEKKITFIPDETKCQNFLYTGDSDEISAIAISVYIPFSVIESNADKINYKTHLWDFTIDDCSKELYIKYKRNDIINFTALGVIGLIVIAIVIFVVNKSKKVNEL